MSKEPVSRSTLQIQIAVDVETLSDELDESNVQALLRVYDFLLKLPQKHKTVELVKGSQDPMAASNDSIEDNEDGFTVGRQDALH